MIIYKLLLCAISCFIPAATVNEELLSNLLYEGTEGIGTLSQVPKITQHLVLWLVFCLFFLLFLRVRELQGEPKISVGPARPCYYPTHSFLVFPNLIFSSYYLWCSWPHVSLYYKLCLHNNSWHTIGPGYMFIEKKWMDECRYIISSLCVYSDA